MAPGSWSLWKWVFTQDPWTQEFGNSCQSPTVDLKFFFFAVHALCGRVFVASTGFLNGFMFSMKSEKPLQQNVPVLLTQDTTLISRPDLASSHTRLKIRDEDAIIHLATRHQRQLRAWKGEEKQGNWNSFETYNTPSCFPSCSRLEILAECTSVTKREF